MGYFDATLPTTLNYKPTTIKTNISAPEFDPDAGRQEAYNQQWKAYIDNLSQSNKKVDLNKAKQYFDTQFDQDWYNEAGQRQQQFNKIFQPSREQEIQNSANAYNEFTTNLFNSFAKPQSAPKPAPKLKTEGLDFSNVQAVQNWLLANNYNPGKADNMYGIKTKTAIDALLNNANSGLTEEEKQLFRNFQGNTKFVRNKINTPVQVKPVSSNTNNQGTVNGNGQTMKELEVRPNPKTHWTDRFSKNQQGALTWNWGAPLMGPKTYTYDGYTYDVRQDGSGNVWYIDRKTGKMKQARKGIARVFAGETPETWDDFDWVDISDDVFKRKNGGIINKHQQGGTMQNEQELQKAFMAFLIEDAAAQGMQIQSEQDLQAYAQQLGEEGLKAKYQEFMQKMQGGVKARLGAKLDYINKLKGNCPDGSEPYYFKEGGSMKKGCKPCMQKAQSGAKTKKVNEVQKFKSRNVKVSEFKGKANEADTVHVNKNIYSLTNSDGSRVDKRFPAYSTEQYKKDAKTKDGKNRRFKQDLVSSEKCGGKAKKNK